MTTPDDSFQAEFEERLRFETLIADLSTRFVNLPSSQVDQEIEAAQRRVCEFLGLDASSLYQPVAGAPGKLTLTHFYRALDSPALSKPLDATEHLPWCLGQALAGKVVVVSSLTQLPPEAARDRQTMEYFRVKSTVGVPLSAGGGPVFGACSFNTLREERSWPDALVKRLQLVSQVFANALARKRADELLRESEARLSLAADSAGAGLWSLEVATEQVWFSARTRELFQLTHGPPVNMSAFFERIHPDYRGLVRQSLKENLETGKEMDIEYRIVLPGERVRWILSRGRAQRNQAGEWNRIMGASVDITERKEKDEALQRSLAEIKELKDRLQVESNYLKAEIKLTQAHDDFVGQSKAMQTVLRAVEQVAPTDSSVLILGETGTGKELVAQAVHRLSPRRDHVMVKLNCAALPAALVESELFGREKGAFTGALTRQAGRFEVANGSTLFLDEIGELSPEVQAKLLRVLQEGVFERLGSPRTIKVNVRVIAATNRNLDEAVRKGSFREDLFYRLNVFPIRVPLLRDRTEDIPQLVWAFLREFSSRMGKKITQVPRATMEALQRRPWPGNVRELRNVIEHAVIVTTGDTLTVTLSEPALATARSAQTMADAEREHILRTLEKTAWHIKGSNGAAELLGMHPSTLYTRMKKLGIPHRRQRNTV